MKLIPGVKVVMWTASSKICGLLQIMVFLGNLSIASVKLLSSTFDCIVVVMATSVSVVVIIACAVTVVAALFGPIASDIKTFT